MDGAIYEWTLKTSKRSREHVIKGCMYTCVIGVPNSKCFLSTSTDRKLREMDELEVFKVLSSYLFFTFLLVAYYVCLQTTSPPIRERIYRLVTN